MDFKDRERELISKLLPQLCASVLGRGDVCKGFERLLEAIDDLQLDIPDAPKIVTNFIARAVVDEVLPPAFLNDRLIMSLGGDVVEQAKVLLSLRHGMSRLARVWGPGDGRPVNELKAEIKLLLGEYLLSKDLAEAARCVKAMNCPSFHHEIVKRGVMLALDGEEEARIAMASFFAFAVDQDVVSRQQIEKGFNIVLKSLPDARLDTPRADSYVDGFIKRAVADNILPPTWLTAVEDAAAGAATAGSNKLLWLSVLVLQHPYHCESNYGFVFFMHLLY